MKNIVYDSERPYIPKTKEELANLLADSYTAKELEKKENFGRSYESVHFELYSKYMRDHKSRLYAIYFETIKRIKNKKVNISRLEKKVRTLQEKLL